MEAQTHLAMIEELQAHFDGVDSKAERALRTGPAFKGSSTMGMATPEVYTRLDRWATAPMDKPFQGADGGTSLKEWTVTMKEQAGYCSENLQKAMEDVERSPI